MSKQSLINNRTVLNKRASYIISLSLIIFLLLFSMVFNKQIVRGQSLDFILHEILYYPAVCNYPSVNSLKIKLTNLSSTKNSVAKVEYKDGSPYGPPPPDEVFLPKNNGSALVGDTTQYDFTNLYVYRLNSYGTYNGSQVQPLTSSELRVEKLWDQCEASNLNSRILCGVGGDNYADVRWKNINSSYNYEYSWEVRDSQNRFPALYGGSGMIAGGSCSFEQGRTCRFFVNWSQTTEARKVAVSVEAKDPNKPAGYNTIAGDDVDTYCYPSSTTSVPTSPVSTPTPIITPFPTSTPRPTPTSPSACNRNCGSRYRYNCPSGLSCTNWFNGVCRNPACLTDTDCVCPQPTAH